MVSDNKAGPDGFRYIVAENVAFFYAEDGLIASTNPVWMQWGFNVLIDLFENVGIITNVSNMVVWCVKMVPYPVNTPPQNINDG